MEVLITPLPKINVAVLVTRKLAYSAYIQLCDAVNVQSEEYEALYEKRLEIARLSMGISRAFAGENVPTVDTGISGSVSGVGKLLPT